MPEAPSAELLAASFAGVLRGWLQPDEWWAEMRRVNATPPYNNSAVCASHNYCDANMAMDAAFQLHGYTPRASSDEDCALWNRAWDIAKARYLTEIAVNSEVQ